MKQVWLADDATGAGSLLELLDWWNTIITEGKKIGYNVNESKSWLILKNESDIDTAKEIFTNTTNLRHPERHLGAAIGNQSFKNEYVGGKITEWRKEILKLAEIAEMQPDAAFSAYIHGHQHKYTYFLQTIDGMEHYLEPLEDAVTNYLQYSQKVKFRVRATRKTH